MARRPLTRRLLVLLLCAAAAQAQEADVTTLEQARSPFEALTEKLIGTTSRAVRFDWRAKEMGFGLITSQLFELNNFATLRLGAFGRFPTGNFVIELAVTRAIVWGSSSTELLAQTPFRQAGRPNRFEIDVTVDYALAEGVVTPRFGFIPPAQLVLSASAGFRYLLYTEIYKNLTAGEVALAIVGPTLSQKEIDNLEVGRLPGMAIEPGRYSLLAGLSLDLYFQSGIFISPRLMLAPSLGAGAGLGFWWEFTNRVGWLF
jgi:hypothetical protein